MSSLRAISMPTQELAPVRAVDTEAYLRPPNATVPVWAARVEETVRVIARLGFSPTPSLVLLGVMGAAAALRHG
jgi:hypothetical protein